MRQAVFLALAAAAAAAAAAALALAAPDNYTNKYDNIDVDTILSNDRLLSRYVECLMGASDRGCTPDGKELKRLLPDAMTDNCAKCTDRQKENAHKVIRYLQQNRPAVWQRLQSKFDLSGSFTHTYEGPAS